MRSELRNLRRNLLLHLLGKRHVLHLLFPLLTEFIERLAVGLLDILITSKLGTHGINTLRQCTCDHFLIH